MCDEGKLDVGQLLITQNNSFLFFKYIINFQKNIETTFSIWIYWRWTAELVKELKELNKIGCYSAMVLVTEKLEGKK
jgi:hypothetical protein